MKNHYIKCSRQWRERKTCKLHFRHLKIVNFQKRMIAPPNVQYHARGRMMADPISQKSRKICVNHRKNYKWPKWGYQTLLKIVLIFTKKTLKVYELTKKVCCSYYFYLNILAFEILPFQDADFCARVHLIKITSVVASSIRFERVAQKHMNTHIYP